MATPTPRVPKAEKGRDSRPNSRSEAWKVNERSLAKWMVEHDGPNPIFQKLRLVTSTGRVGHLTGLQFDAASFHYAGECKRRESAPAWLTDCWAQVNQIADEQNLTPLLGLWLPRETYTFDGKQKRLPELHVIRPERHAELLRKEKEYDALVAEGKLG